MKHIIYTGLFINLILLTLITSNLCYSQVSTKEDVSSYFDDGGISEASNILSVNSAALLVGDLHCTYERKLWKSGSVEIGAGVLLPYYMKEINYYVFSSSPIEDFPDGGYSFNMGINIFYKDFPEDIYISANWRQRNYVIVDKHLKLNDFIYSMGARIMLSPRFLIDYNFGFGYRFAKWDNLSNGYVSDNCVVFPIALKLEYLF